MKKLSISLVMLAIVFLAVAISGLECLEEVQTKAIIGAVCSIILAVIYYFASKKKNQK